MDKDKLNLWKYVTYIRLQSMNSYYFPLEPFYIKGIKENIDFFRESLKLKNKGLYVHIPFCITECSYCACTKMKLRNPSDTSTYVDYLIKELEIFYRLNGNKKLIFNTLTFGGGTPSILSPSDIKHLFEDGIYKYIEKTFLTQISFEAAPYTITKDKIIALKQQGVNRMSFGIQSLDREVLKKNNRPYISIDKIGDLVDFIHKANISIEADLIVGIKGQSVKSLIQDVKFLLSKGVDDITFNYFSPHRYSKYSDSKETIRVKEYFKLIDKKLFENGQIKGTYCFQERYIYSARRYSIIGLGYGATSNLGNSFVYVKDSLQEYYDLIDSGKIPISSGIYMNDDFEFIRYVYWNIVKGPIDLNKANEIFGEDMLSKFDKQFRFLEKESIVKIENNIITSIVNIDKLFIYLTVFIDDIIENSKYSILPRELPKNMDIILRQMIYDYVI